MNKDELKKRISIQWKGYGTYKVTIEYRGKIYSCTSHNSLAYDRIKGYSDDVSDRSVRDFYTYKSALQALWNECKENNLL